MTEKTNIGTKPKKPKPKPETLARPETKPELKSIKVKNTVVKPNEIKLFLEMKKRERELKLKQELTSTIPPKENPPSTSSTSATLVQPNNSLPPSAPRATCDTSGIQSGLLLGLSTGLSTTTSGPDELRAHSKIPDKSGLLLLADSI